ncbi:MAG: hypothetical protein A2X49_10965 [Lentisphaerae bacterium GWF2_52_8]|nr:MAG: hypothetical protein A2X49_10965 [Lentisphaerae bacterium GWF2_52_8]
MKLDLRICSVLLFFVTALPFPVNAEEGKIIAVYGDVVKNKTPAPGWNLLWNANGEIGNAKNYVPLPFSEKDSMYAVMDEAGKLKAPRGNFVARDAKDSIPRFYIASYAMQDDSVGDIWLNNGNIQFRLGSTENLLLNVYLNDELKTNSTVKKDRVPMLFQQKLGRLRKGDVITVAVGPGAKDSGFFGLQFTVEEFPEGIKPGEPANIISPPITAFAPKLGFDGKTSPGYAKTQKAHCDNLLKNRPELVFLGDSITAGWNAKVLAEKFGKYKPANLGISGDWIQNVNWRVKNGVLDQVNPKLIVLMIGTNNLGNGFSPEEVVEGTELLLKTIREKSPQSKILLLGIFPRGRSIKEPICESIRQVNSKTAAFADNKTVFFMDITDKLIESDGTISKEVMPDGLHPAEPGYRRWADAILPMVEKLCQTPE